MSFKVRLEPSLHEFDIEGKESILSAGMRHGLNLAHSCMNGSCGDCAARLVRGQVHQVKHNDYVLNDQQKNDGYFLTCCFRPLTDLVLEMHELTEAGDIPYQEVMVKVAKLERLQDDVMQLHLRASRQQVLDFLAGQRVKLCFADGRCLELGIASCPCDGLNLRFHIRLGEDEFSRQVFSQLRKGEKLEIHGPVGEFTLNEDSSRPLVFIAWETGFAQVQSLIDHAISIDPDRQIALYWLSAIPQGHYLSNYCRAWRDVLDNFCYESIDLLPAGSDSLQSAMQKMVEQQKNLNGSEIYAIMPEKQLSWFEAFLREQGFPASQRVMEVLDLTSRHENQDHA